MKKSYSGRKYRRTLHRDGIAIPGDSIVKASHIVAKSKEGGVTGLQRFHNVEDFVEITFDEAIKAYERDHGEIKISPSGLSAYDSNPSEQSE